jgi:UDP-glucose 4-epimerase
MFVDFLEHDNKAYHFRADNQGRPRPLRYNRDLAKILVTGGAGYIGSHTVHLLLKRGHDCIVVDNLSKGYRHNVPEGRLREISLSDTNALYELMLHERFDAVIHFAAFIAVGESTQIPEAYFVNNVSGSLSLIDAMIRADLKRIVFSSTAAVYGTPAKMPITEDMPHQAESPYGESKVMVEKLLQWFSQYRGLNSVCLRYFNACGAEPDANLGEEHVPETHLIPLVLRAAAGEKPVTVFGSDYATKDGSNLRDYIHVMDLATAHLAALHYLLDGGASDQFNVGTGEGYTVFEVMRAVEATTGRPVPHTVGPRRAGDPVALIADSTKLRTKLGWTPTRSTLSDVVRDAWRFEPIRLARAAK